MFQRTFLNDLQDRLQRHFPVDTHETVCHKAMKQALRIDNICSSTCFEPGHFTASMFVLSPNRKEVLLIWHDRLQLWVQPGGHLAEEDQNILAAALREVEEETTLIDIEAFHDEWSILDLDIHQFPANPKKNHPPHKHYDVRFLGQARVRRIKASNEIKEARWIPLDSVHRIQTDGSVRRAIRSIHKLL